MGFRPFIYTLAVRNKLCGYVRNTGKGVQVYISGVSDAINRFMRSLESSAFDARYDKQVVPFKKITGFKIIKSKKTEISSDFPADLALCEDCKKELFSKNDRRYKYPFISCVKCGPRFSVIKKLPYDRKNTTMKKFKMCPQCLREYSDPASRRFHAQPNACGKCGPKLSLFSASKKLISEKNAALEDAVKLLKCGKILAVKGIGGYHLCCDATNPAAVKTLRKRKNRPYKPFAVMSDAKFAAKLCHVNDYEKKELTSPAAAIVLLRKKNIKKYSRFAEMLAPDNQSLGIMYPYAPLHHLLINEIPLLVMTSGNKSDEPICSCEKEAFENLNAIADYFLTHDRDIENRQDDSIVRFLPDSEKKIIIRRSRGYVPAPVKINTKTDIFASGGDLKNNFCFIRKGNAYLSQFTGDLYDGGNAAFYGESIKKMKKFLDVSPARAVCDTHPAYYSSSHAKSGFKNVNEVLHHYAHMASVMAEHKINGSALGFIFDGSGYGEDGNIWGGEIVFFGRKKFKRLAHFDNFSLPGGEICVKEVWRVAVSLLHKYGLLERIPGHLKKYNYKTAVKMIENNINSPLTSSAGRIFDAVSALLDIKTESTFEAEAAVALESCSDAGTKKLYQYDVKNNVIDLSKTFEDIIGDLEARTAVSAVSAKFHNTVADIILKTAETCSKVCGTKTIILGGGFFQNMKVLNIVFKSLLLKGFNVLFNEKVPLNDGGICLGQAYVNNLLLKNK